MVSEKLKVFPQFALISQQYVFNDFVKKRNIPRFYQVTLRNLKLISLIANIIVKELTVPCHDPIFQEAS